MLTKKATANISNFLATIAVKAAAENSPLAPHVVKDLQQQAQQQAQARGGIIDPSKIKQPSSFNPYLTGSLIGAGAGGLIGLLSETRKKKKDRNYLRSVLGTGLAGAGLGLGLGALPTALQNIQDAQTGTQSIGGVDGGPNGGAGGGANLNTTPSYYRSDNFWNRLMQDLGIGVGTGTALSRTGLSAGLGARNVGQYVKDNFKMLVRPVATTQREIVDLFVQHPNRRVQTVPEGLSPYKDKPGGAPLSYEEGMKLLAQNPARFRDYQNQIAKDRQNIANARVTAPNSPYTKAMEARLAADKVMRTFVADNFTELRKRQQAATSKWIKDRPGGRDAFTWNTVRGIGFAEALRYLQNKITGGGY